jgi:hypothetical protein
VRNGALGLDPSGIEPWLAEVFPPAWRASVRFCSTFRLIAVESW